jgi:cell division protease FtsH
VKLPDVAAGTPGMVGADLKNLVNEAALLAARRRRDRVTREDFSDALERIVLGTARHIIISDEEKRRTAFHESGHALVGMITPGADRVRKVSIIPHGEALGATFQAPGDDRHYHSAAYLRGRIIGALGGRAAEELVFGDTTTGAESDLQQVTAIARQMVGRWGMSEAVGPVSVLPSPGQEQTLFDANAPSSTTRDLVDSEVRRLVEDCYREALATLRSYRSNLDLLATRLQAAETLDEDEAYDAAQLPADVALTPAP